MTEKQWHIYLVQCADGSLYTGCTNDLETRLTRHNSGRGAKYTAAKRPVTLVYQEICQDKSAALKREHQIKQLTRAEKLRLIEQV